MEDRTVSTVSTPGCEQSESRFMWSYTNTLIRFVLDITKSIKIISLWTTECQVGRNMLVANHDLRRYSVCMLFEL